MQITCNHPASRYGIPVFLSDAGHLLDPAPGIKALRAKLHLSTQVLSTHCGVSPRTVEGWEQGRHPTTAALNAMAQLLNNQTHPTEEKGTENE